MPLKFWQKVTGEIVVDAGGQPIHCRTCPCDVTTPCGANVLCCCQRLKLVITGFVNGNLNGTVFWDVDSGDWKSYNLDIADPGLPTGIASGTLDCVNGAWEFVINCVGGGTITGTVPNGLNECPTLGVLILTADEICGPDTGSGTLSCANGYSEVVQCEYSGDITPCYMGCRCTPRNFEVLVSEVVKCDDCFHPRQVLVPDEWLKVVSLNGVNALHCLPYVDNCIWQKIIANGVTIQWYSDETCTTPKGEPINYDLYITLTLTGGSPPPSLRIVGIFIDDADFRVFYAETGDTDACYREHVWTDSDICDCDYDDLVCKAAQDGVATTTPCCST